MPNKLRYIRQYFALRKSGLFDARYYMLTYPDVRRADVNPLWHFLVNGWREYRNPSDRFNTEFYLSSNRDVATSGINPLYHYLKFGQKEGRSTFPAEKKR
jgi:hypothetical protein